VIIASHRDRWLQPLTNVMCRHCGLIFLQPMPTDNETDDHYRNHFWLRSQGTIKPTAKQIKRNMRNADTRMAMLAHLLKPNARILDVGAGSGEFVALAQSRGFQVEGVEPSADYAGYAERTYRVKIHAKPFLYADLGSQCFDIVTCSHALEHMRDPLAALEKINALLASDGHAFVWVPDLAEPGSWPYRAFHPGHLYGFTYETLAMMMAKAGFELAESHPHGTCLILKRRPAPDPNWFRFPDHAKSLSVLLNERTVWSYLMSWSSWARIPSRIMYWFNDHILPSPSTSLVRERGETE
jgi:2-polyprenyl-3-methyl-5-hydroxy-6-metoxy-1,4-benzoquinol methylase